MKRGSVATLLEVFEDRVEPLDMPHLQDATVLLRQRDQFGGLATIIGHGLFHQNVAALLEQGLGELEMRCRGSDQAQSIAGLCRFGCG